MFGLLLGTGDYGHLVIEHASMLMRTFGSMKKFSNQGFESAHKVDRRLYQQATNHDTKFEDSSGLREEKSMPIVNEYEFSISYEFFLPFPHHYN